MLGNSSYAGVAGHRIGLQAGFLALKLHASAIAQLGVNPQKVAGRSGL